MSIPTALDIFWEIRKYGLKKNKKKGKQVSKRIGEDYNRKLIGPLYIDGKCTQETEDTMLVLMKLLDIIKTSEVAIIKTSQVIVCDLIYIKAYDMVISEKEDIKENHLTVNFGDEDNKLSITDLVNKYQDYSDVDKDYIACRDQRGINPRRRTTIKKFGDLVCIKVQRQVSNTNINKNNNLAVKDQSVIFEPEIELLNQKYVLRSVIIQKTVGGSEPHYTAYIRHKDQWYYLDDSTTKAIELKANGNKEIRTKGRVFIYENQAKLDDIGEDDIPKIKGMDNVGNSCFLNSAFQSVIYSPIFNQQVNKKIDQKVNKKINNEYDREDNSDSENSSESESENSNSGKDEHGELDPNFLMEIVNEIEGNGEFIRGLEGNTRKDGGMNVGELKSFITSHEVLHDILGNDLPKTRAEILALFGFPE
jgi:hypothetical protein